MNNPYFIEGPALISFSGGRSSGFMLRQILDAHGGQLPDDVHVVFANTGREMPETLDFVQECGTRWGVSVVWLEYRLDNDGKPTYEIVDHNSASRNGEPFEMLIDKRQYLPNPVARMCTAELKIRSIERWAKDLSIIDFSSVIGLRADEKRRVSKIRNRKSEMKGCIETSTPMADANHTVADVSQFWKDSDFDLMLPNNDGKTPLGNCDLCYLKGASTIMGIVRDYPERAQWWADMENRITSAYGDGALFRKDRPSYREMIKASKEQMDLFDMPDEPTIPCTCTD